jgi:circadian clock protein KaiB
MEEKVLLKLFVAGKTDRSKKAIAGITVVFDACLKDKGTLEIIDVLKKPHMAAEENVLATPTLIRVLPEPVRRLIGDFSDGRRAFDLLALTEEAP